MVVKSVAINAYESAMDLRRRSVDNTVAQNLAKPQEPREAFSETLKGSLKDVQELQSERKLMIEEFASGKNTNVHELMISMQKASMAMSMTNAVRSKVMTAYQEVMRMPF